MYIDTCSRLKGVSFQSILVTYVYYGGVDVGERGRGGGGGIVLELTTYKIFAKERLLLK